MEKETIQTLEETMGEFLFNISGQKGFLTMSQSSEVIQKKVINLTYQNNLKILHGKSTICKVKRQLSSWETTFATHVTEKG